MTWKEHGPPRLRLPVETREAVMLVTGDKNGADFPKSWAATGSRQIAKAEYWLSQRIRPAPESL
jgi:hypothetical protein